MIPLSYSEVGTRILLVFSFFLICSMGALIYETNGLIAEFENFITYEYERFVPEHPEFPTAEQHMVAFSTMVRQRQSRFFSTVLVILISATLITLLFSLRYVIRSADDSEDTEGGAEEREVADEGRSNAPDRIFEALAEVGDLLENGDSENGLGDDDFSEELEIADDEDTGVLANSYNKMVEALQRTNELEKELSSKLAAANEQLENEISERKRAEKEIRHLSRQLISGIEDAQKKLAQDLHDEFGQTLAALHMEVETLWNSIPDEMAEQKMSINDLIRLIEDLGDKIRSISSDLRPDLLDDLGLIPTLNWYSAEFMEKRPDIGVRFQAVGFKKRLCPETELILYRIFQESLNNVVKHAKAQNVTVMLTYSYPKVILMIRDDGIGFDPDGRYSGIGLLGMRERVVSANGTIDIRSEKGKGATIRVELPVS